jgi:hypothetical protein
MMLYCKIILNILSHIAKFSKVRPKLRDFMSNGGLGTWPCGPMVSWKRREARPAIRITLVSGMKGTHGGGGVFLDRRLSKKWKGRRQRMRLPKLPALRGLGKNRKTPGNSDNADI